MQEVKDKLEILKKELDGGDFGALAKIRSTVLGLVEPPQLVRLFAHQSINLGQSQTVFHVCSFFSHFSSIWTMKHEKGFFRCFFTER